MTARSAGQIASPLAVLYELRERGVEDVLILGYTLDLGFIETLVLGPAVATGGRLTVVADYGMAQHQPPDPRLLRHVGLHYLHGYATTSGAFHPKLVLAVGPDVAVAAIGSGNPTLAGWQHNAELWTVLSCEADVDRSCGNTIAALGAWIRALPDHIRLSEPVTTVLREVGELTETAGRQRSNDHEDEVALVHNLEDPILEQLPRGPINTLDVCAPYHDAGAEALKALVDRLGPRQLRISYQPGMTNLDGPAIGDLGGRVNMELSSDGSDRFRHGKLISGRTGDDQWALTGSANLSSAALLQTPAKGGNVELALLSSIDASLLPAGPVQPVRQLRNVIFTRLTAVSVLQQPSIFSAIRTSDGIDVTLHRPADRPCRLERALARDEEEWEALGDVEPGATDVSIQHVVTGGSPLRLTWNKPIPGASLTSYVIDPIRARAHRVSATSARVRIDDPYDLFAGTGLERDWLRALEDLISTGPEPSQRAPSSGVGRSEVRADKDGGRSTWEEYLSECTLRLGDRLTEFAFGLPALRAVAPVDTRYAEDEDEPEDESAYLSSANEEDEQLAASDIARHQVESALPDLSARERARRRYQDWGERLVTLCERPQAGLAERMLGCRLVLMLLAVRTFPDEIKGLRLLRRSVLAVAKASASRASEPSRKALVMLGLSVIESAVPPTATTEVTLLAHELRDLVSDILGGDATLDQDRLAEYCRPLVERLGDGATEASVQWTAEDALAGPRQRAIWVLQAQGIDAEVVGEVLVVRSDAGNLPLEAVRAIAAVEDCDKNTTGAWAVGQHGAALAVWKPGQLHVYEPASSRWVSYRAISPFSNPRTWSSQRALPTQQRQFRRGLLPPDDVARVLVELNIDPAHQPIPPA